jgi:hypothetical protein
MFRTEHNNILFSGKIDDDLHKVSAALFNLTKKQGYSDIILDFSAVTRLSPRIMLPLSTVVRAYRRDGIDFDFVLPQDQKLSSLLRNTNWLHLMAPERFEPRDEYNVDHLSAIQFSNAEQHDEAINRSMNVILQSSRNLNRNHLKALEWSLNEITDNVLNHAQSPMGGVVQVVNFARQNTVDFYVCDAGIGIPASLRQGHPEIRDDVTALERSIREGVTRNVQTNQGNGLFGTFKCCEVSRGQFEIQSGYASLVFDGSLRITNTGIPFRGTFVRASINYGVDRLLERALIFKGRQHVPAYDYIDRFYQSSGDDIHFVVKKEISTFGSREAGRIARTKIENLMNNGRFAVIFDFYEINLISSSFADEVFGKLFVELGPVRFGQLCRFKNIDGTVQRLIDRAISQRVAQTGIQL